ncbi:MAG: MATE family efflux transporter, partial [Flavobacteriaceae bacterium]
GHQCGGYCSGSQTYRCGQNLGAKQPDRAAKAVWKTSTYNVFFMGVLSVVFLIWPRSVVEVFSAVPKVIDVGVLSLHVLLQAIFSMPLGWS